jgi:hypothetical protein
MNPTRTLTRIAAAGVFTAMLFPTAAFAMEGVTPSDDPDVMTITTVTDDTDPNAVVSSEDSTDPVLGDGTVGVSDDLKRTTAEELMSTTGLPVADGTNSSGVAIVGAVGIAAAVGAVIAVRRRTAGRPVREM